MVVTRLNSVRIRRATQGDLEGICRIEDDSFTEPYPHNLLAKLLRDCPDNFFVAEATPRNLVGYCVASQDGNIAHLISIGVLREYRRRGVGTELTQALIGSLGSAVGELRLEVKQGNTEAIQLYEGLGFRQVNFIENYYGDGSPALKMWLTLNGKFRRIEAPGRKAG